MKPNKSGYSAEKIEASGRLVDMTDISARIQSEIDGLSRVLSEYEKRLALKQERIEQLEDHNVRLSSIEDKLDVLMKQGASSSGRSEQLMYQKKSELLDSIIEEAKSLYDNLVLRTRALEAREAELGIERSSHTERLFSLADEGERLSDPERRKLPYEPAELSTFEAPKPVNPPIRYTYTFELPEQTEPSVTLAPTKQALPDPPAEPTPEKESKKHPLVRTFEAAVNEVIPDDEDGISLDRISLDQPIERTLRARGIPVPMDAAKKPAEPKAAKPRSFSQLKNIEKTITAEEPDAMASKSEPVKPTPIVMDAPKPYVKPLPDDAQSFVKPAAEPQKPRRTREDNQINSRFASLMSGNLELSVGDLSEIARAVDLY